MNLPRDEQLKLIWRHTHKDYRGTMMGNRTILVLRAGGTTLVMLKDLTDAEIADKLPYAIKKESAVKQRDLTPAAQEGYSEPDAKPPYLATAPYDSAWRIGRWLARTGRTEPKNVRASRGDTFHVNDMKVRLSNWAIDGETIERIA